MKQILDFTWVELSPTSDDFAESLELLNKKLREGYEVIEVTVRNNENSYRYLLEKSEQSAYTLF